MGTVSITAPGATVDDVPMLRGRLTALKGQSTENYPAGDAAWVLRGDRGLTHSPTLREGSEMVEGWWWGPDHTGDSVVSV